jgi:hypothetical protein
MKTVAAAILTAPLARVRSGGWMIVQKYLVKLHEFLSHHISA